MKIIVTGATGMVGEGVLLECLNHPKVTAVLMVNRSCFNLTHPKLKELIVPDFLKIEPFASQFSGYDACFYCAGISSIGIDKKIYFKTTFDTTISFAKTLLKANPRMIFHYITGKYTDSNGKSMWARVKGRTEKALDSLPFKANYNLRPGLILPMANQKNSLKIHRFITWLLHLFSPKKVITIKQLGKAMIHSTEHHQPKSTLEISDILELAKAS